MDIIIFSFDVKGYNAFALIFFFEIQFLENLSKYYLVFHSYQNCNRSSGGSQVK